MSTTGSRTRRLISCTPIRKASRGHATAGNPIARVFRRFSPAAMTAPTQVYKHRMRGLILQTLQIIMCVPASFLRTW